MAHLLRNLLHIYLSPLRRFRVLKKHRVVAAVIGLVFLPAMIILQTQSLFEMWLFLPNGSELLFRFVSLSLLGVFFLLFLTSLPSAMHHLFMDDDLPMLLSFPVKVSFVYARKFIQVVIANFGMFALLGLPLLLSMIAAIQFNAVLVLLVFAGSIFLVALASGFSALVAVLLARFFVIKQIRRYATLIMGFFVISAWASFQFLRISALDPSSTDFDPAAVESFSASSAPGPSMLFPSAWLVALIRSFYGGSWLGVAGYFLILAAAALFIGVVVTTSRASLDRFDLKLESGVRRHAGKKIEFASPKIRFYAAVLFKDVRLTFRDTRFFQSTLILFVMLILSLIHI